MTVTSSTPAPAPDVLWPFSLPFRTPLEDVRAIRVDELLSRFEADARQTSLDLRGDENVELRFILHGAWVAVHELRCRLRGVAG